MSPYIYLIPSVLAFLLMGLDKRRAQRHKRRIPEATLWTVALLGGGPGAYLGMVLFRHKTLHLNFAIGFTLLAVIQLALFLYILP